MKLIIINHTPSITIQVNKAKNEHALEELQKEIDQCTTEEELTTVMEQHMATDPIVSAFYKRQLELKKRCA